MAATLTMILFSQCPKSTTEVVKALTETVEQTCFPGIYARSAERLLRFLNKELRAPGYHYRKAILSQSYMLRPKDAYRETPLLIAHRQNFATNRLLSMAHFWKNSSISRPQIMASLLSSTKHESKSCT